VSERAFLPKPLVDCLCYLLWMRIWISPTASNTAWIVRSRGAIPVAEVILAAQEEVAARAIRAVVPPLTVMLMGMVPARVVAVAAAAVEIKGLKGNSQDLGNQNYTSEGWGVGLTSTETSRVCCPPPTMNPLIGLTSP